MRHARTHKLQLSGSTVHFCTVFSASPLVKSNRLSHAKRQSSNGNGARHVPRGFCFSTTKEVIVMGVLINTPVLNTMVIIEVFNVLVISVPQ